MMRVATHNAETITRTAHLLARLPDYDYIVWTRFFFRWRDDLLQWTDDNILESLQSGEPVRGLIPSGEIDTWAN